MHPYKGRRSRVPALTRVSQATRGLARRRSNLRCTRARSCAANSHSGARDVAHTRRTRDAVSCTRAYVHAHGVLAHVRLTCKRLSTVIVTLTRCRKRHITLARRAPVAHRSAQHPRTTVRRRCVRRASGSLAAAKTTPFRHQGERPRAALHSQRRSAALEKTRQTHVIHARQPRTAICCKNPRQTPPQRGVRSPQGA